MISLVSTSLAATAFFLGLKLVGPSRASILSTAELVISVVAAFVLFGEVLSGSQLFGGLLILFAAVLASLSWFCVCVCVCMVYIAPPFGSKYV